MPIRQRIKLFFAFMDHKQAFLTGLPHLLYGLRLALPGLFSLGSGSLAWQSPAGWLFAAVIISGLAWGLRQDVRNPPLWLASWAGYGLVLVLEVIINVLPGLPSGTFTGILWLAGYSAAVLYLGRRERARAVLASLPVAPVFVWSMILVPVRTQATGIAAILFAGLVMAAASALFESLMWGRQVFWTVVIATLVGGLPVALINANLTQGAASPAWVIGGLLSYLIAVGIFSWPAWVGSFWDWLKSKAMTGV